MEDDDDLECANEFELQYRAEDRASVYAPKPQYAPADAGQLGLLCVVLAFILFSGFAEIGLLSLAAPLVICAAIGFWLPYRYFTKLRQEHQKAWSEEYKKLRAANPEID